MRKERERGEQSTLLKDRQRRRASASSISSAYSILTFIWSQFNSLSWQESRSEGLKGWGCFSSLWLLLFGWFFLEWIVDHDGKFEWAKVGIRSVVRVDWYKVVKEFVKGEKQFQRMRKREREKEIGGSFVCIRFDRNRAKTDVTAAALRLLSVFYMFFSWWRWALEFDI